MSWTDERIALLKKMWKEGKSAAEIAKMLAKGVTRNAVIGKAHRMGLSGRPSPIKKPTAAPKKEKEAAPKKEAVRETRNVKPSAPAAAPKMNPHHAKEAEDPRKVDKVILPLNGGIPLIDLTERMCKWPIGDPKEDDFTFCGRGIRQGTPYCPDHAGMAYQTSSRSRNPLVANDRRKAPVKEAVVEAEAEEEVEDVVVEQEEDEEVTA